MKFKLVNESIIESPDYGVGGSLVKYNDVLRQIDIDADRIRNRGDDESPASVLIDLGYQESDNGHQYSKDFQNEGDTYTLLFDFSDYDDSFGELPATYYVLKNGKVPHGYTTTKMPLDEGIIRTLAEIQQNIKNKTFDKFGKTPEQKQAQQDVENTKKRQTKVNQQGAKELKNIPNKEVTKEKENPKTTTINTNKKETISKDDLLAQLKARGLNDNELRRIERRIK